MLPAAAPDAPGAARARRAPAGARDQATAARRAYRDCVDRSDRGLGARRRGGVEHYWGVVTDAATAAAVPGKELAVNLSRWIGSRRTARHFAPETIYAVGDIHGQADKFYELAGLIERDLGARSSQRFRFIVLGDFIDRGPGSRRLINLFMRLRSNACVTVLKGNHEAALAAGWRGDHDALSGWYANGGEATLAAYDIDTSEIDFCDTARLFRVVKRAIPAEVIEWLEMLPISLRIGDYYFVHAGVRPGIPFERQTEEDRLWIREEFTQSEVDHGAVIVHGHTVSRHEICFAGNRIGVDTGAYLTGELSAVAIAGATVTGLTTSSWPAIENRE